MIGYVFGSHLILGVSI